MKHLILICSLLFYSCASRVVHGPVADHAGPFPFGKYQHDVKIEILPPAKPQHFDVNGILKYQANQIQLVGLSPMGLTLFRVTDNRDGKEPLTEVFVDAMKPASPQVAKIYELLREILLTPSLNGQTRDGTHFDISEPDENKIPKKIEITNKHFHILIRVAGYEI